MSQDKIDIKDVTPKTFNPKTHKGNGDRFNPSNRIYVRESKGTYQKTASLRRLVLTTTVCFGTVDPIRRATSDLA